jgi:hypothetical protein
MPSLRNLGYLTDSIVHAFCGVIEEKASCHVIRTPSNPTYYWGNLLVLNTHPLAGDFDLWMAMSEREFDSAPGHTTFGWDTNQPGETSQFTDRGFELESNVVLELDELKNPRCFHDNLEMRSIQSDEDWKVVTELQIECGYSTEHGDLSGFRRFKELCMKNYRRMHDAGRGDWWGAFLDGELVGDLGLYFTEDKKIGRFQSVETAAPYRCQGVCSTLLFRVCEHALVDSVRLIIVTESDSKPESLYRSLGFEFHSRQYGVCRRPQE